MTETDFTLDMKRIPEHIAIIMDGNGRWATERGKDRSYGHQAGVDTVRRITSECTRLGVKYLTLYTFSTENWNRPADEVAALMGLVLTSLEDEIFMKNNVRFRVIGDRSRIPAEVDKKLTETEEHTAANSAMTMIVALSYSSKLELVRATQRIAQEVKDGQLSVDDIDEGITHIVRGEDIRNSTARQIALMEALGRKERPVYLHHPLIVDANNKKLSKRELAHSLRQDKEAGISPETLFGRVCYKAHLTENDAPRSLIDAISIIMEHL